MGCHEVADAMESAEKLGSETFEKKIDQGLPGCPGISGDRRGSPGCRGSFQGCSQILGSFQGPDILRQSPGIPV
jgi:hypothetical protein